MPKVTRNLVTFRAAHDEKVIIPNRIKAALADMEKKDGPESYAYEVTDPDGGIPFIKRAGISTNAVSQYREQFKDYVVTVEGSPGSRSKPRFVWFATVRAAKKAKGE